MITDDDDPAMILMLTAANAPTERVAGLALGADDYLSKPFHSPSSSSVSVALARRKPTSKRRALRAAGIELDQIARTASRDGRQLDLSTKEFGVLEALLKASPIPVNAENHTNPVRTPHQLGREADGIARRRRLGDLR
jgi:DNA-binding response OmpR family regulator